MSRVLEAIVRHAAARPDETAITGDGPNLTWRQLLAEVEDAARWLDTVLAGRGAGPVATLLDNGPAWVVIDLALIRLGRAALPLPAFFSAQQRSHAVADAGAAVLLRAAGPADPAPHAVAGAALAADLLSFPLRPLHSGTAKITYTSGSTGTPKGVCLSLASLEAVAASLVEVIGAEFAGVHMPVMPLGVLLENVAGLYPTLLAGGRYHAVSLATLGCREGFRPDLSAVAAAVAGHRVTSLILVPELLRALTAWLTAEKARLPSLKLVAVGGAKVAPQLLRAASAAGLPAYEGYGLSECASVVALNTPRATRGGSVGRVLPHLKVAAAEDGELTVGPSPFLGYVGGPPHAGVLRTGDLGEIDADGFVNIRGRKSNLLITAFGRNISPEWVEGELTGQPEILQAVVFGEAAPELCAILVPSREDLTAEQIGAAVARANEGLPAYARVGSWRVSGPFDPGRGELTDNGRPRRAVLRERHRNFIDLAAGG
jgi:long-chain acyl-CoA synthetase